jgi:uncharacterized protein YqhQ
MFTGRLRRVPLIRGILVLAETLTIGMRALNYSASIARGIEDEDLSNGAMASSIAFALAFAVGLFFIVPAIVSMLLDDLTDSWLVRNAVEGLIRLLLFLGYIWLISRVRDIRRVFMYHGAEHMTVHATEHGNPLTIENVRQYPTAHPRCGTAFLLTVIVLSIVAFLFVSREPVWWLFASRVLLIPVIAAVSYEVIRLSGRYSTSPLVKLITWPNLALQSLTTRQPDDDQIEIATVAMQNAVAADERSRPVSEVAQADFLGESS